MARNRKKVSLYEVMGKSWSKSSYDKTLKKLPAEKSESDEPTPAKSAMPVSGRAAHWPRKPKIAQFNAGRIEISMPYPLAIALLLGVVLLVLVALWLGEIGYLSRGRITNSAGAVGGGMAGTRERPGVGEKMSPDVGKTETGKSKGSNRIVIQTYRASADLEPVQQYFAQFGIETEIREIGDTYYLVTKNKYENPGRKGTDGYAAIQEIIKWGAQYKAPPGSEPFAPRLFSDAYGMKFDD